MIVMQFAGIQHCPDECLLFGSQGFASQFPVFSCFLFQISVRFVHLRKQVIGEILSQLIY